MKKFISCMLVILFMLPTFFSLNVSAEELSNDSAISLYASDVTWTTDNNYIVDRSLLKTHPYVFYSYKSRWGTSPTLYTVWYLSEKPTISNIGNVIISDTASAYIVNHTITNDGVTQSSEPYERIGKQFSIFVGDSPFSDGIHHQAYLDIINLGYIANVNYSHPISQIRYCNYDTGDDWLENIENETTFKCPLELVSASGKLALNDDGKFTLNQFKMTYDVEVKNISRNAQKFYITFDDKSFEGTDVLFKSQEHMNSFLSISEGEIRWSSVTGWYMVNGMNSRQISALCNNMARPVNGKIYINAWLASNIVDNSSTGGGIHGGGGSSFDGNMTFANPYYRKCFGSSKIAIDVSDLDDWRNAKPDFDINDVDDDIGGNDTVTWEKPFDYLVSWFSSLIYGITHIFDILANLLETVNNGFNSLQDKIFQISGFLKTGLSFLPEDVYNILMMSVTVAVSVCIFKLILKLIFK